MNIGSAVQYYESYAKQVVLPRLRSGLRIVHIAPPWIEVPPIKYGGTEIVVERVAIGQQELGLNVAVLCRPGSTVSGAVHLAPQEQEWRQHLAHLRHDEIEMFYATKCVKWMKAELGAGHAIDIIHTHVRGAALLYICREFAEAKGIPVVHTVHLPVIGDQWKAERERYCEVPYAYLIGISQYHGRELMDQVGALRCAGIVYNPLPGDVLSAPIGSRAAYAVYAARIAPDKRQDLAVQVALRARVPLILVGKVAEDRAFYEQQVLPFVDGHHIVYVGEVGNEIRDEYLAHASFALAPIQWNEPNGIGHTLAASLGAPVIYFGRGALTETLWDGVCGVSVPPDDLDAMVEAISRARALNSDRCSLVTLARFNYRRAAAGYMELYADLLQGVRRYGMLYPNISEHDIVQPIFEMTGATPLNLIETTMTVTPDSPGDSGLLFEEA
ncbi:MAG: glycosyltransferase [Chloroflexi bacterium]|nr:glycosyltransferase [Ktedonobacteraceae bacterium]MBV9707472.1 glycosyltransferase [Chloroflexota bacterium]